MFWKNNKKKLESSDIKKILQIIGVTDIVRIELVINGGTVNLIYEVDRLLHDPVIVKVFDKRFYKKQIQFAINTQTILAHYNLAPKVYFTKKNLYKGVFFCLMEKGESPDFFELNTDENEETIRKFGELLGEVHHVLESIDVKRKHLYLRYHSKTRIRFVLLLLCIKYYGRNKLYYDYTKIMLFLLRDMHEHKIEFNCKDLQFQYIHGDFRKSNIVTLRGKMQVIDFDQSSFFPRCYELYKFVFDLMDKEYSLKKFYFVLKNIVQGYLKRNQLTRMELIEGFKFYYYIYITDYRACLAKYKLKDNENYILCRINRALWCYENYDNLLITTSKILPH